MVIKRVKVLKIENNQSVVRASNFSITKKDPILIKFLKQRNSKINCQE